jgi:hypothetical protein
MSMSNASSKGANVSSNFSFVNSAKNQGSLRTCDDESKSFAPQFPKFIFTNNMNYSFQFSHVTNLTPLVPSVFAPKAETWQKNRKKDAKNEQ